MQVFDASSMIYAWDNYPIELFPPMWEWLHEEVRSTRVRIPQVAFEEIRNVAPQCAVMLLSANVAILPMTNQIVQEGLRVKQLLGIAGDKYGAGVGENDLFIVATAKIGNYLLISDEAIQAVPPKKLANYKIPAVCGLDSVSIPCYSFLAYLKRSGQVFR